MKIYSDNFPVVASNYEKKDSMWLDNIIGFSTEVPVFQCITTFYEWDAEFYDQTASLGGKQMHCNNFGDSVKITSLIIKQIPMHIHSTIHWSQHIGKWNKKSEPEVFHLHK